MPLVPHRFLVRFGYDCPFVVDMPGGDDADRLVELPPAAKLDPMAKADDAPEFADVRLGWNDTGLGLCVVVRGVEGVPQCDPDRPRLSDGVTLWVDTRGDRTSHRATRTCHQFHFLPAGDGPDRDEPFFMQTKINRALHDAPVASAADVPYRCERIKGGYRVEAFLPAGVLNGFDPEQHPRLGVFYAVRDRDRGEQTPGVEPEFPFADDPSLWATLDLVRS